jgi:hypothetical protein
MCFHCTVILLEFLVYEIYGEFNQLKDVFFFHVSKSILEILKKVKVRKEDSPTSTSL